VGIRCYLISELVESCSPVGSYEPLDLAGLVRFEGSFVASPSVAKEVAVSSYVKGLVQRHPIYLLFDGLKVILILVDSFQELIDDAQVYFVVRVCSVIEIQLVYHLSDLFGVEVLSKPLMALLSFFSLDATFRTRTSLRSSTSPWLLVSSCSSMISLAPLSRVTSLSSH